MQKKSILQKGSIDYSILIVTLILIAYGAVSYTHLILEIDKEIASSVKQQIDKSQREYFLREQMKVIQKELGETENDADEIEELRKKIK